MTTIPTMTAVVLTGHGGFDKMEYRTDWPVPEVGPNDVLVRVGAAGMNNTDINTRTAWYSASVTSGTNSGGEVGFEAGEDEAGDWSGAGLTFPRIQGMDAMGTVAAVGEQVSDDWLGARVMVDPWLRDWDDPMERTKSGCMGSECDGGFAQYVVMGQQHIYRINSSLSDAELASFPCAYITAENMLERVRLGEGETMLITGASGGVGSALIQLAKRRGTTVIAMAGASKLKQVLEAGADFAIPRTVENVPDAVKEVSGLSQLDVVADVVAGPVFPQLLELLRRGGRYVTAGAIAGPMVELDVRTLYLKDLELIGSTVPTTDVFPNLIGYIERGEIKPLLSKTYPLSEIKQAQQDFLAKKFVGKLVLVPPK